jgi:hypothetical protein
MDLKMDLYNELVPHERCRVVVFVTMNSSFTALVQNPSLRTVGTHFTRP